MQTAVRTQGPRDLSCNYEQVDNSSGDFEGWAVGGRIGCNYGELRALMRTMAHYYDEQLAQAGLRTTQFLLLARITAFQPVQPSDVAAGMRMDPSTLSRNVRPLVNAGWVIVRDGLDARSKLLSLTAEGKDIHAHGVERWRIAQQRVDSILGVQRTLALRALVGDCARMLAAETQLSRVSNA